MFIPQNILDEILNRIDALSFFQEYVPLVRSGKDYKGLCPFHQEKSPSFMVSPDKRVFYCFGCGEGGNLFRFLMKLEGLNFPEAAQKLAGKTGVDLSQLQDGEVVNENSKKQRAYKINRYALWYFKENLKTHKKVQQYLNQRKITTQTQETFQIGYAPDQWEGLVKFLENKKVPLEEAQELGLIKKRQNGTFYDFFRNRLMFPIMDFENRVIGFGGRRLDDNAKEAKYLNSQESNVYHKSNSIYGCAQAKSTIRESQSTVLVEGYMDLVRLYQEGIQNVAAPLGTALTLQQVNLLSRYSQDFVLMFDGDTAGKRALMRALQIFLDAGIHPRVVFLPEGEDPDTYIDHFGSEKLKTEITKASFAIEWMMVNAFLKAGTKTSERIKAATHLMPFIQKLTQELERKSYLAKLSQLLGVNEKEISNLIQNKSVGVKRPQAVFKRASEFSLERNLLQNYVKYPDFFHQHLTGKEFDAFEDEDLKVLGQKLFLQFEKTGKLEVDKWIDLDEITQRILSEWILSSDDEEHTEVLINDNITRWKLKNLESQSKKITQALNLAEMQNDQQKIKELLLEKKEAEADIYKLKQQRSQESESRRH